MSICAKCHAALVKRPGENPCAFTKRIFCDRKCSKGRTGKRGRQRLLSDAQCKVIASSWRSVSELAREYDVAKNTITAAIKRASNTGTLSDFAVRQPMESK